jgi:tetratricopeptide (TPR) repeat protein
MKKIFLYPILFGCFASFGQLTLQRADQYFKKYDFEKAAYFYKAFLHNKDDAYSQLQLAKIYTYVNDPVEAERWYREVMDREDLEPVHYLNYAQSLSALGRYSEALPYYEKYRNVASDKLLAEEKVYGVSHINDFFADSALITVQKLEINTVESDYVPAFYGDNLVFSSSRSNAFGLQRKFSWNDKNYLDLYLAKGNEVSVFDKHINSKFHEGSSTFSKDGNTIYFTRNNYNHGEFTRSNKGINMIKIYTSTKDANGNWGEIKEFQYNSDNYSTGEPSLSEDGLILYFISDMPNGFGGTDIYKSIWNGSAWGEPINLGHKVNTESNERTPFLATNNYLYFASEGHFGLGGLDIYEAEAHGGVYDQVRNIGYPANSSGDDFGFILNGQTKAGYFSSNRKGGKGDDDIYAVHIKTQPNIKLAGNSFWRKMDQDIYSRKELADAKITVKNLTTGAINELYTDEQGSFILDLASESKYEITASKAGLINSVAILNLTDKSLNKSLKTLELILVKK